jgi:hypothetical protein
MTSYGSDSELHTLADDDVTTNKEHAESQGLDYKTACMEIEPLSNGRTVYLNAGRAIYPCTGRQAPGWTTKQTMHKHHIWSL